MSRRAAPDPFGARSPTNDLAPVVLSPTIEAERQALWQVGATSRYGIGIDDLEAVEFSRLRFSGLGFSGMDERKLAMLWRAQRLDRSRLRTTDGRPVEVVYRGRPSRSPGPDFQSAILVVGGELTRGDVELHVRSSAWSSHRHHRDRRYNGVVLHVVLQADPDFEARTASGQLIPCLALSEAIGENGIADSAAGDDIEGECRRRVGELSDEELGGRLDALGDLRLDARAAILGAEIEQVGAEQALHAFLLEGLGYSQNRAPARELAGRLTVERLYALAHRLAPAEATLLGRALLFGVGGLLPSQRQLPARLDWSSEQEADELEGIWRIYGGEWAGETLPSETWTFGVRPLNSPPRRLAGFAEILGRSLRSGLVAGILGSLAPGDPRAAARRLVDLFVADAPGSFWAGYFDFGRLVPRAAAPRLVGGERAREIAASVALPFVLDWANTGGKESLASRAREVFAVLPPLPLNEVTRSMIDEVIGPERRRIVRTARRQQGLHHLFRVACDQRLCDRCPLFSSRSSALPTSGTGG